MSALSGSGKVMPLKKKKKGLVLNEEDVLGQSLHSLMSQLKSLLIII